MSKKARERLAVTVRWWRLYAKPTFVGKAEADELIDAGLIQVVWPMYSSYRPTALALIMTPKEHDHA